MQDRKQEDEDVGKKNSRSKKIFKKLSPLGFFRVLRKTGVPPCLCTQIFYDLNPIWRMPLA